MGLVLKLSLEEDLGFESLGTAGSINYALIQDLFECSGIISLPKDPYVILSLDTEGLFPAIHSWPFFNSFCEIDGELFATAEDGVYQITGDDDSGEDIHTGAVFKTDFGISNNKKVRAIILTGDIDDVTVQASAGDESGEYTVSRNRVYISRNIAGRDWDLRITDFDRLEGFEVVPIIGRR